METCYVNERYGSPMKPRILPVSADQVYGKFEIPTKKIRRSATLCYAVLHCATLCGSLGPDPSQLGKDLTSCKAWSAFSGAPLWKQALMRPGRL